MRYLLGFKLLEPKTTFHPFLDIYLISPDKTNENNFLFTAMLVTSLPIKTFQSDQFCYLLEFWFS